MLPENSIDREFFARAIPGYAFVLRDYLRGLDVEIVMAELTEHVDIPTLDHKPNSVANALWLRVDKLKKEGIIDGHQYRVLDEELRSFTDILGISERIKNSPIPYSYSMYIKKFIFTFIITLPFAFITD